MKYGIENIVGRTISTVRLSTDGDELFLFFEGGGMAKLYHCQDCCESVVLETNSLEELSPLEGQTVLTAEEVVDYHTTEYGDQQYTFYNIQGNQSNANLRWYGESNGYYSIGVTVEVYDSEEA